MTDDGLIRLTPELIAAHFVKCEYGRKYTSIDSACCSAEMERLIFGMLVMIHRQLKRQGNDAAPGKERGYRLQRALIRRRHLRIVRRMRHAMEQKHGPAPASVRTHFRFLAYDRAKFEIDYGATIRRKLTLSDIPLKEKRLRKEWAAWKKKRIRKPKAVT